VLRRHTTPLIYAPFLQFATSPSSTADDTPQLDRGGDINGGGTAARGDVHEHVGQSWSAGEGKAD
jgi:hypothetical protein